MRVTFAVVFAALLNGSGWAQILPQGFVAETLATGLSQPTGLAFLPDGRVLVSEQVTGAVKVVLPSGIVAAIGFVNGVAFQGGETGLLGLTVDPLWPQWPYLYVLATRGFGGAAGVDLVRYEVFGDLTNPGSTFLAMGSPSALLSAPNQDPLHNGGTVRFGPDGMLYVSLGDDARACDARDREALIGKVLRLDVSGWRGQAGDPPSPALLAAVGNPFSGPLAQLVYAEGFRNPFRFQIDPATGTLFVGDVGGVLVEELNVVIGSGLDFGWPLFEGGLPGVVCPSPFPPALEGPAYSYPNPPDRPAAIVVLSAPYHHDPLAPYSFGPSYDGVVFVGDFPTGVVRALESTGLGTWQPQAPVPGQPSALDWAQEVYTPSDGGQGPDGALYLLRYSPGALYRIRPGLVGLTVVKVSGDAQIGAAGGPLADPLVVRVLDALGSPVPNVPVTFSLPSGGGALGSPIAVTDASGLASTTFVLPVATNSNPIPVFASVAGGGLVAFTCTWTGLTADLDPLSSSVTISVRTGTVGMPVTLVAQLPLGNLPVSTPWGPVFVSLAGPPPGTFVRDGLGLFGSPDPGVITGPTTPEWSWSTSAPPGGGAIVLLQAFALDALGYPAPGSVLVSNSVVLVLP